MSSVCCYKYKFQLVVTLYEVTHDHGLEDFFKLVLLFVDPTNDEITLVPLAFHEMQIPEPLQGACDVYVFCTAYVFHV
jgi:hypothetical protein